MSNAEKAKQSLRRFASKKKAKVLQSFFKTRKGQYGEDDIFIGVRVPEIRSIAKTFTELPFAELKKLLNSKIHEERSLALIILVER